VGPPIICKATRVGPPIACKPASCQENYFYFLFYFWDLMGYNYSWPQVKP